MTTSFLGVDISKRYLDCYDSHSLQAERVPVERLDAWSRTLALHEERVVVFEATGVYGKRLGKQLQAHGIAYAEVNPRHVRRFAQACGQLAKNDRIDALTIARYASACGVRVSSRQENPQLRTLVSRREQLQTLLQMEQGHRESCDDAAIAAAIDAHIASVKKMLKALGRSIEQALEHDARAGLLMSMPGIGPMVTACLLAYLPELGSLGRGQAAALAGLAPYVRDSGVCKGKRVIYGGRPQVRKALYMAALVAIRHNPRFMTQYQQLRTRGKPFKVAIVAIMRKVLETLNAMGKANTAWNT